MLPLSEELRQAITELRTWAALHRANDEPGIASALAVVERAAAFIARAEKTHPHSPSVLPDVGPRDVLVFRGVEPGPDPAERHVPLLIWLYDDSTVEKLNEAQMAAAGWIRKP